jgi:hypothetical protein
LKIAEDPEEEEEHHDCDKMNNSKKPLIEDSSMEDYSIAE